MKLGCLEVEVEVRIHPFFHELVLVIEVNLKMINQHWFPVCLHSCLYSALVDFFSITTLFYRPTHDTIDT